MNYLLHANISALHNLVDLFQSACEAQGVKVGQTKATIILMKLIEDAKRNGLLEEVPEVAP